MRVDEEQDARIGEHAGLDMRLTALQSLAGRRAGAGLAALVEVLGDLGFSWRDVARTAGSRCRCCANGAGCPHERRECRAGGHAGSALRSPPRGHRRVDDVPGRPGGSIGPARR